MGPDSQGFSLLERVTDGFVALDRDWHYVYVNRRGAEALGRKPEELIGKHIWTEFPEGVGQPFYHAYLKAAADQTPITLEAYYEPWNKWFENGIYPSSDGLTIYYHDITERKRLEEAMRESEARLRLAVEAGEIGLFDWDLSSGRVRFSREWKRQIGYRDEEIADQPSEWESRVHPDDLPAALAKVDCFLSDRCPSYEAEFRLRHKDGSYRWILARGRLLRDEQANPRCLIGTHMDLTERKRAEESLRESEERFRSTFEEAAVGLAQLTPEGRVLRVNPRLCQIVGYSQEELLGRVFKDFASPDDLASDLEHKQRLLSGAVQRTVFEGRFLRRDGSVVWLERTLSLVRKPSGEPSYILSVSEDISDRKRTQAELERQVAARTAELADLYNNAPSGNHVLDATGRYVMVNDTQLRWMGYTREEMIGRHTTEFFTPESVRRYQSIREDFIRDGHITDAEFDVFRKDGSILSVRVNAVALYDDAGAFAGVRASLVDFTERKRAAAEIGELNRQLEAQTRHLAELNRELEAFTYSVSHDLKAPLRAIDGYSRLLAEGHADKLDEDGLHFVRSLRAAARQMSRLIEDLLAYSRLERRQFAVVLVDLRALAEGLVAERAAGIAERKARVVVGIPALSVAADPEGLTMALRNLLDNALKFTRDAPGPEIEIGGSETPHSCILWVRDNGPGFDMRYHDRIFEIFQRLHRAEDHPGTGIGLALVRKAMERLGGRAWAESAPGAGATFYLEIPR